MQKLEGVAQVLGFLLPIWEILTEFLAPGSGDPAAVGIWSKPVDESSVSLPVHLSPCPLPCASHQKKKKCALGPNQPMVLDLCSCSISTNPLN